MKNIKKSIFLKFLILSIMSFALFALKQDAQDSGQTQDDVTVIQSGKEKTDKEKGYDKAYRKSKLTKRSGKLSQARPGDFDVVLNASVQPPGIPRTKAQVIEEWVCSADIVLIGRAGNKTVHLNEEESLVYSEYEISVQDIIKSNPNIPIQVNNLIQITRPGGNIRLDGRLIRFMDGLHSPLQNGKSYLLFLKYVPEVNGYIPTDAAFDYLLDENKATPTIRSSMKGGEVDSEDAVSLLDIVRATVTTSRCEQN